MKGTLPRLKAAHAATKSASADWTIPNLSLSRSLRLRISAMIRPVPATFSQGLDNEVI